MGAELSSLRDKVIGSQESIKRCYYDVLGVGRQASDNEIKKAFRAKALQFHPDRNYGDVDNATKRFAELQSAYEVLSDLQERAWYDSHRDAILQNCDPGDDDHFERNVQLTSAEDIVKLISNFSSSMPFTDKPNGFFGTFRSVFAILANEEIGACDLEYLEATHYPSFGSAEDSYDVVRLFYATWVGFSTKKNFSWKDAYKCSEAHDRQTRRFMEKKNKRLRDDGVREFNEAVKSLVRFVRKRDPRYRGNFQSEEDRQQILREAAAAQAARSRAANQAKIGPYAMPALAQVADIEEEIPFSEPELSDKDLYECIACTKIFKSENQYEAHERSKKHIKAIRNLRKRMERENEESNIYSEIFNRGDAIKRSDFKNGSRSTSIDMQPPLQARGSSIEYSDGSQNTPVTSAHVDSGTETNLFQELGARLGDVSTLDPILARDEILDEHASRKQMQFRHPSTITDMAPLPSTDCNSRQGVSS